MNPNNRFLASGDDDAIICMGCNKEVYPNDRVMALKGNWHRGCLKCTECGITLSVRMLESFQNKPYCRAHKPNPRSTQVTDSVAIKTAAAAPKAVKREAGVKKDVRMTFIAKPGAPNPLTANQAAPHAYTPAASKAPSASNRVQGVNKLERRTFFAGGNNNPVAGGVGASVSGGAAADSGYQGYGDEQVSYDQGGYDQSADQGGYDQGGYDQGGYDQSADQGGYDQGGYDQGGYDQGGYDQEGYDQGGYDQSGYDQGGYDQGGYDQGYDDQYNYEQ